MRREGAMYDTGMLIAVERRKQRALAVHEWLLEERIAVSVPWVVIAEFWRGRIASRLSVLDRVDVLTPCNAGPVCVMGRESERPCDGSSNSI